MNELNILKVPTLFQVEKITVIKYTKKELWVQR